MNHAIAKKLFLRLASAARKVKNAKEKRIEQITLLEKELVVAEHVFDKLSEHKKYDVHVLLRINSRINALRKEMIKLKEKIRNS